MTQQQILQAANDYVGHPFDMDEDVNISVTRGAFIHGSEWADRTMIDKACNWLENAFHQNQDKTFNYVGGNDCTIKNIVAIFHESMEE